MSKENDTSGSNSFPWLALLVPIALAGTIYFFSPNFRLTQEVRNQPLAGDFVQDWVGGYLVEHQPQQLYDGELAKSIQHDAELVGFAWPKAKYFPMVYPPFFYAAMWPFSKLHFFTAAKVWLALSTLAFCLSAVLLYRFLPRTQPTIQYVLVACLVFTPLIKCFGMSHKSTWLLLILTVTYLLIHHRRPLVAGLVFGLIAFKPHLGIVIGCAMLMKRQWSFAAGAVATVSILVGSSWLWEPSWWPEYLKTAMKMGDYVQTGGYQLSESHSFWGAAQLTFGSFGETFVKVLVGLISIALIGVLGLVLRGSIETQSCRFAFQYSALVLVTILLSPHFYTYDLTILVLPVVLCFASLGKDWLRCPCQRWAGILLAMLFFLAGSFSGIAETIRVQPSVFLMVGVLVAFVFLLRQSAEQDLGQFATNKSSAESSLESNDLPG